MTNCDVLYILNMYILLCRKLNSRKLSNACWLVLWLPPAGAVLGRAGHEAVPAAAGDLSPGGV